MIPVWAETCRCKDKPLKLRYFKPVFLSAGKELEAMSRHIDSVTLFMVKQWYATSDERYFAYHVDGKHLLHVRGM